MDGLKGLVWLSRIGRAESGGVLWGLAGLPGQLSCSRQGTRRWHPCVPGDSQPSQESRSPGGAKQGESPGYPAPWVPQAWVFTDVDKIIFQDTREGSGALGRCPWRDGETRSLSDSLTHSLGPARSWQMARASPARPRDSHGKGGLRRRVDGELPGGVVAPVCSKSNGRSGHFALDSGSPRGLQGSRH